MGKDQLRAQIRQARVCRVPGTAYVEKVLDRIAPGSVVCCYVALPGEPPTEVLIAELIARGCTVLLPVAEPDGELRWADAAHNSPWRAWGVPGQPDRPEVVASLPPVEVVVVPALAVDPDGRRLGQGGGYYDRFLPTVPDALRIALLWTGEVLSDVCAEPHDVSVHTWVEVDE